MEQTVIQNADDGVVQEVAQLQSRDNGKSRDSGIPSMLPLHLSVIDREVIDALWPLSDRERNQFALDALRIGVLAVGRAQGEVNASVMRNEGDRLIGELQVKLGAHGREVGTSIENALKGYFDPSGGRFNERVERLIKEDGELASLLRRQIGGNDSELARTLSNHIGSNSPLMKLLDPDQSNGLLASLKDTVQQQLDKQRDEVVGQFSLDKSDSALARFIAEIKDHEKNVSGDLQEKIKVMAREFSLDNENSALSRMVGSVKKAQETITQEFSLDTKGSALSRLAAEIQDSLKEQKKENDKFYGDVRTLLDEMKVRRGEAERSTRHGLEFEAQLLEQLQQLASASGDVMIPVGSTTGVMRNCRVGDAVIELGPESAFPGARIVVEAKKSANYTLPKALEELKTARDNRQAQVGLFVFSKGITPDGIDLVHRVGNDIVVSWDSDNPASDIVLKLGLSVSRALCVRQKLSESREMGGLDTIDRVLPELEKQVQELEQVETWAGTIESNGKKIIATMNKKRTQLLEKIDNLKMATDALRSKVM